MGNEIHGALFFKALHMMLQNFLTLSTEKMSAAGFLLVVILHDPLQDFLYFLKKNEQSLYSSSICIIFSFHQCHFLSILSAFWESISSLSPTQLLIFPLTYNFFIRDGATDFSGDFSFWYLDFGFHANVPSHAFLFYCFLLSLPVALPPQPVLFITSCY